MSSLRTSVLSGIVGYRSLFVWIPPGLYITSSALIPLLQIGFFVLVGATVGYQDPTFFIVGNSVQAVVAFALFDMAGVLRDERRYGALGFLLGSPASRVAVLLGRMLPGLIMGFLVSMITSAIGLTVLALISGVSPLGADGPLAGGFGFYAAALVVAALASAGTGLALSALGLIYRDISQITGVLGLLMMVVSGANVLRSELPVWLQWVGNFLPTAHSIDVARSLGSTARQQAAGGDAEIWMSLGWGLLVGVGWMVLGLLVMRIAELRARSRGTLDIH